MRPNCESGWHRTDGATLTLPLKVSSLAAPECRLAHSTRTWSIGWTLVGKTLLSFLVFLFFGLFGPEGIALTDSHWHLTPSGTIALRSS